MSNLSYGDYSQHYADKCSICQGKGHVLYEDIFTMCICQHTAKMKWRFEQLEITPKELKYKSWNDFCGVGKAGDHNLVAESFILAKKEALKYCFGSDNPSVIEQREDKLIVYKHLDTGKNVIIIGGPCSGKTLLSTLIIKEVVYACRIHNLDITFKSIKSSILQNESRWDGDRTVNHDLLNELENVDFLIIDNIDRPQGGHNTPPDTISLNALFYNRRSRNKPTIIICSDSFWGCAIQAQYQGEIKSRWGDEFITLLLNNDNTVIRLQKETK